MSDPTLQPVPAADMARIRELECDVINRAYHEAYEASCQAADELVALAAQLLEKHGPVLPLLALRARYVASAVEKVQALLATLAAAERAGDASLQAWAAFGLASHYVEEEAKREEAVRLLAVVERHAQSDPDGLLRDEVERLRHRLNHPPAEASSTQGLSTNHARPPNHRMHLTRSALGRRRGPRR